MTLRPFRIHPDITRATTLPSEVYHQRDWYDAAIERVFAKTWHLTELPRHAPSEGQAWPITLLGGSLDEALVVTNDAGRLRCLSNVCTHRGAVMLEKPGPSKAIRCNYHGRCFDLKGKIQPSPGFEGAHDFPSELEDLPTAQHSSWRGFSFVGLQPEGTLDIWFRELDKRVGWMFDADWPTEPTASTSYEVDANWACYVDNYQEGFHIPFVHPALSGSINFKAYRTEVFEGGSVQIGSGQTELGVEAGVEEGILFDLPEGHVDYGQKIASYYFWLFPTTMLNFYPWGLSINMLLPQGPDKTEIRYQTYVYRPELTGRGAGGALDLVEKEDDAIVERVQRGVKSRLYRHGRYAPKHEAGTHLFHRLMARYLCNQRYDSGVIDV